MNDVQQNVGYCSNAFDDYLALLLQLRTDRISVETSTRHQLTTDCMPRQYLSEQLAFQQFDQSISKDVEMVPSQPL